MRLVEQAMGDERLQPDAVQQQIERRPCAGRRAAGRPDRAVADRPGRAGRPNRPPGRCRAVVARRVGTGPRPDRQATQRRTGQRRPPQPAQQGSSKRRSTGSPRVGERVRRSDRALGGECRPPHRRRSRRRCGRSSTWCNDAAAFADKKVEQFGVKVRTVPDRRSVRARRLSGGERQFQLLRRPIEPLDAALPRSTANVSPGSGPGGPRRCNGSFLPRPSRRVVEDRLRDLSYCPQREWSS